jgi:alpha-mannosidase
MNKKFVMIYQRVILFCLCPLFHLSNATAQIQMPVFGSHEFISGYAKDIQGETISYFSLYQNYVKEALLTRCTDGNKIIEWESDPIPAKIKGDYAYFAWITGHSTGTSSGDRNFDLYINDSRVLTFVTKPKFYQNWSYAAPDSTKIVFEYKKQDGAKDAHGMTYLRVPLSKYEKGRSLKFKIVGHKQESNDWYMVFKYSFKEKLDILPLPFLIKNSSGNYQPIQISALHFGKTARLKITVNEKQPRYFDAVNGFNTFEITVPAVNKETTINLAASIEKSISVKSAIRIKPVTPREVYLVHHSHTDIGYSHIQEEVEKIHTENIKRALELIEKTRTYPEGSRFIWNIESSWAVENFFKQATPEESQKFIQAVREGSIVISATYANVLTGLCNPEEMNWITEYSRRLRDSLSFPVNTAMMSDIPGMSWSMVPALASQGIRYFSNGPNYVQNLPDHGDRIGHTLREQGNKAFWWKSTSAKDTLLIWTCGKGYSSWHGFAEGAIFERGPEKIADYLNELDSINYPYEMIQWRYNIGADNGPVDGRISDFVKQWNEKYSSPKLVLANVSQMFKTFEQRYGKSLPVLQGDFTPYWEDGAYSTAKEEGDTRLMSERLLLLIKVAQQKKIPVNDKWLYKAQRNIVMFHEHTWGSWNSISEPDSKFTRHQWEYKKRFLDSAQIFVAKIESSLRQKSITPARITVVNTSSWTRSDYVEIDLASEQGGNMVIDGEGIKIPAQRTANGKLCFVAKDVPSHGEKIYRMINEKRQKPTAFNAPISYTLDSITGAIKNLQALDMEWVNPNRFHGLLQALYVKGLNPDNFNVSKVNKIALMDDGPVLKRARITCTMEGANEVVYEISLFNYLKYIRLTAIVDKKPIREKESVHLAFPFSIPDAKVRIGMDDSFITTTEQQIPGSNKDFYSVQRWLDVSGSSKGVTISSPQAALFEIGQMINEEKVQNGYKKWRDNTSSVPNIFLYAMNNYWHTNYKADQNGKAVFDIYLNFHKRFDHEEAKQFGIEVTQPLMVLNGL